MFEKKKKMNEYLFYADMPWAGAVPWLWFIAAVILIWE